jgi:uncharacterized protein
MLCEQTQTIPVILPITPSTSLWRERTAAFFDTNATAASLATSFALGTLISILPTPGFNLILTAILAARFKSLNKAALIAAATVWNAFVVAPLYALSYQVGEMLFGVAAVEIAAASYFEMVKVFAKGFLVGNLIVTAAVTAISYLVVKTAVTHYRHITSCVD